jgi:hypothetical protein
MPVNAELDAWRRAYAPMIIGLTVGLAAALSAAVYLRAHAVVGPRPHRVGRRAAAS